MPAKKPWTIPIAELREIAKRLRVCAARYEAAAEGLAAVGAVGIDSYHESTVTSSVAFLVTHSGDVRSALEFLLATRDPGAP